MRLNPRLIKVSSVVAIAVLLGHSGLLLTRKPRLGVADNGDYWRVMTPAGIFHPEGGERARHRFVLPHFPTRDASLGDLFSSSALLAWSAKHITWGLRTAPASMDLRQMGILCLLLATGVIVFALYCGIPPPLCLLVTWVITDPGFLLYFNSFYAESAIILAIPALALWIVGRSGTPRGVEAINSGRTLAMVVFLLFFVFLGGGCKAQNVLLPTIVLGTIAAGLIAHRTGPGPSTWLALSFLLFLALWAPVNFFWGPGPHFPRMNNYHAVFAGIAYLASNRDEVLEELQIPREYHNLPESYWQADLARDHALWDHLDGLSHWQVMWLYLTDPRAIRRALRSTQHTLTVTGADTCGNYERSESGRNARTFTTPWSFDLLRCRLLRPWPKGVWILSAVVSLWIGLAMLRRSSWNGRKAALLFLLLWFYTQCAIAILGEGIHSLPRHLLSARLALDLGFVFALWEIAETLSGRLRRVDRKVAPTDLTTTRGHP